MYKVTVKPQHERKEIIQQAIGASDETIAFYEYQNKKNDLPVVRLDIGTPIYRMANYRTRTAQLKYIHENRRDVDFFLSGQENESSQQAQHGILVVFARQGKSGSISPIMEELSQEEQREPLLITAGGVVVNGNRRLAAMRELFAEQPSSFRHYSHTDCAILPENVKLEDIREIEVRLQMRPETKLPYEWVNESLAIKDFFEEGKSAKFVADLMKKKKKEVERAARALTEAEIYLKEWLREPGEYQYVEDAEQFFNDLAKALENKQGDDLEVSRRIAWALISNSKKLNRRVYDYNFSFGGRTEEIITSLVECLDIDLSNSGKDSTEDDLDIDIDDGDATSLDTLIEVFDDPSQRDAVVNELISVCDSIIEQDKQGEIGRRALEAVKVANNKLQEVDLSKADNTTYASIRKQLDSVLDRATKLKSLLEKYIT